MSSAERGAPGAPAGRWLPGEAVGSAQVSDSLDAAGRREHAATADLRPVGGGPRAAGRARTVAVEPSDVDPPDPYDDMIAFVDSLGPGDLVVVAGGSGRRSALWGGLFSAAAQGRGAVGAVVDGDVRDVGAIAGLGWPVFARGSRPLDYRARMRVAAVDVPVRCAGMAVAPGELVVADADGAVAVPGDVEDEVRHLTEARRRGEGDVLAELLAGATLAEVWRRHRVL